MPIYVYRCSSCSFQNEHLQKVSDARLTCCPECGKTSYEKMLTAAGFQLKGSGWYATDFKGSGTPAAAAAAATAKADGETKKSDSDKPGGKTGSTGGDKAKTESPAVSGGAGAAVSTPAPAAAPASPGAATP